MKFFKKYPEIFISALFIAVYFFTRLYNILSLPIFTDEAIYVRWSQIASNDASWRFISLTDGKQPSFVWIAMVIMKFVSDPLLAGRLVSVFAGLFSLVGIYLLGKEVFKNKWIGIISSLLYLIFPMALVYDKMALYDSLVAMFAIWALYVEILLVRKLRLDIALILGMIFGGAVLTKTNGFFSIYLLPLSLLLLQWNKLKNLHALLKWIGLASVSVFLGYFAYFILRLSPFFHIIAEKNTIFVYPFSQWLEHPFTYLGSNLSALINWFMLYATMPAIILMVLSFFIQRKFLREKLLLSSWFLLPFLGLALFGKTLYPRFILFMIVPLLPLAAYSIERIFFLLKNKSVVVLVVLSACALMIRADYYILFDFSNAPIPRSDLNQFVKDWPAGGGIREAVKFFKEEARKGKIFIGTDGTFGLLPFAFEIYLVDDPNITVKGYYPINEDMPAEIIEESKKVPTYFVFYQPCLRCVSAGVAPSTWKLTQIYRFTKKTPKTYFTVYKVSQQ